MENDEAVDMVLDCADCKQEFVLKAEELDWYSNQNLERPKRCEQCRRERKSQRQQPRASGYQNNDRERGPDRNFNSDRNSGPRRHDEAAGNHWLLDDRPHFKISCRTCREDAYVPFIPRGPAQCQRCHSDQKQKLENTSSRY